MAMCKTATMKIWDVELGLSIHIKTPNDKYIVIDLGRKNDESPLQSLRWKDVGYMVITHPHRDHIDDIINISNAKPKVLWRVKDYTRNELLSTARNYTDRDIINRYCDFVDSYNSPISTNESPSSGTPFDGLTAEVFQTNECGKSNINNFSAITVVKLSGIKIVICGDNESASFNKLMENTDFKNCVQNADVLIAAHHGRESGYHNEFVNLVSPRLTIVSDTINPDTTAASRYSAKSKGWTVYDKWGNGEIRKCLTTRSDGNIEIIFGESSDSRYVNVLHVKKLDR